MTLREQEAELRARVEQRDGGIASHGELTPVIPPPWYVSWRWVICGLLFLATTINYVDRAVLGVLAPTLRHEIGWSDQEYGNINAAFTLAYAIGFLFAGWFIDRVGTRVG